MSGTPRANWRLALLSAMAVYGIISCTTAPPRSTAQIAADNDTATRVQAALAADPNIFARNMTVTVENGVVTLGGLAGSNEDILAAGRDASAVPGVKGLHNNIQLETRR